MDNKYILIFLKDLKNNNSLEWMHENKAYCLKAREQFAELINLLIEEISLFDNSVVGLNPKDLIFRLNRDTRFSKDKSPYKPAFRAHISAACRLPVPVGPYLNIEPGNCFLGGGIFASVFPNATKMVRDYILENPESFQKIVDAEEFKSSFEVIGAKLKNVPKGYPKDHPLAEYLKYKSWCVEYHITDDVFESSDGFVRFAAEKYKIMQPLNDFLNAALINFELPER